MTDSNINITKIKGKLMWPKLFKPDTAYDHRWTVDVLLDAEGLKDARAKNLRVKVKDSYKDLFDGYDGSYVNAARAVFNKTKNADNTPPVVKDSKLRIINQEIDMGNGTDGIVRGMVKTRNMRGIEMSPAEAQKEFGGYGLFLTDVMIVNLVPYERETDPETDFVPVEGGFEAPTDAPESFVDKFMDDEVPFDA